MSRIPLALLMLMTTAGLAACGQSGPLYLPGNPSKITTTPPGQPADDAASDREREENGESDDE